MAHDSKLVVAADGSVQTAIKNVHDTSVGQDGAFCILGFTDKILSVISEGKEGGLAKIREIGLPADASRFILFRHDMKVELANTSKFVFIHWLPDGLKPMAKAALSVQQPAVSKLAKPYQVDIVAGSEKEITDEIITDQLLNVSGLKKHQTEAAATRPQSQSVSVPKTERPISPRQSNATEAKFAFKPQAEVVVTCENDEEFKAALTALRNSKSNSAGWVAAKYAKKDTLSFVGTELESLAGLPEKLTAAEIVFALVRTTSNDGKATTAKFHFINWVGGDIKPMMKAEVTTRMGQIVKMFGPSSSVTNASADAAKFADEKTYH